jgi:tetratricopeptide (TPR) repeat protein
MPDAMLLAMPGLDWSSGFLYDGYVKFGMWDEMLAEPEPNAQLPGATINYLQARATALAAKGRFAESEATLAKSQKLIDAVPAEATQGNNSAGPLYAIGQFKARARLASAQGQRDQAIAALTDAVAAEDKLSYNEPSDLIFPVRPLLGAELLAANRPADAEAVFKQDLERHPHNGWSLYGLSGALTAQNRNSEAAAVARQFEKSWRNADVRLASPAF